MNRLNKLSLVFVACAWLGIGATWFVNRMTNPLEAIKIVFPDRQYQDKIVVRKVDDLIINNDNSIETFAHKSEEEGIKDLEKLVDSGKAEEAWVYYGNKWEEIGTTPPAQAITNLGKWDEWELKNLWTHEFPIREIPSPYKVGIATNRLVECAKKDPNLTCYHIHTKGAILELPEIDGSLPSRHDIENMLTTHMWMRRHNLRPNIKFKICSPEGITEYGFTSEALDLIYNGEEINLNDQSNIFTKITSY